MTTLPAAGSTVCTAATITSLSPLFTLSVNVGRAESENEIEKRREEMRSKNLNLRMRIRPSQNSAADCQRYKEIK
jgi:hypothetical protein